MLSVMKLHESTPSQFGPGIDVIQSRAANRSFFQHNIHMHVCAESTLRKSMVA